MNSDNPINPHGSRVIIRTAGGNGNLENFRFITKGSDQTIGLLASYDLKYILQVSSSPSFWKYINYIIAPGPIVNWDPWPNWVTSFMMFDIGRYDYWSQGVYTILTWSSVLSDINDHNISYAIFDVLYGKDEECNFVVAYPYYYDNIKYPLPPLIDVQFKLENPIALHVD